PHSWKVSSRGGVAAGVSGGREDGAAGGTGQGSRLVPVRGADWYRSGEQTGTGQGSRLVPVRGADWYRSGEQTGTGQGSRLVPVRGADWYRSGDQTGPRGASLGIVPSTPPDGPVGDSEDPAPSVGNVKSRPFGESYRTVRWAGSRGYEPGSGRGRACMATLELRILRRFAWSCG